MYKNSSRKLDIIDKVQFEIGTRTYNKKDR